VKHVRLLFLVCFYLLVFSCRQQESAEMKVDPQAEAKRQQYLNGVMEPNRGLEDIELGKTTYAELIASLGDQYQVSKQEVSESSCHPYPDCTKDKYTEVKVTYSDIFSFGFEHLKPGWDLNKLLVTSILVDCYGKANCPFQGLTKEGIKIGHEVTRLESVYGQPLPNGNQLNKPCFSQGVCFHFSFPKNNQERVISAIQIYPRNHPDLTQKRK